MQMTGIGLIPIGQSSQITELLRRLMREASIVSSIGSVTK